MVPLMDDLQFEKGITIPEINAAPILWRLVCSLGGGREFAPQQGLVSSRYSHLH